MATGSRRLNDYGLSVVLMAVFVCSLICGGISGWFEYAAEAAAHGQSPAVFGDDGYAWTFLEQTFQNWQSEFLALVLLIVLAVVLVHRGSPQSRDSRDEMTRRIARIEKRVNALAQPKASS